MNSADATPICPPFHELRAIAPALAADDPELLRRAPSATARALARGEREPRPKRRDLVTHALKLAGHKIHVSIGFRPDGTVMEFFLDLHREGAPMRGVAHIVATLASQSLQSGVPLRTVCGSLRSTFFEPAGAVEGHDEISHAESLFDLVAQVLEREDSVLRAELAREQEAKTGSRVDTPLSPAAAGAHTDVR